MSIKKFRKILKNNKGFSLIELIVVVAILGVLAGVAAPNIIGAVNDSKINADLSNATIIANSVLKAIAEGDKEVGTALSETAITATAPDWLLPEHLNRAPEIKLTSKLNATTPDKQFYITISDKGQVKVFANTGTEAATSYKELYPTPNSDWTN